MHTLKMIGPLFKLVF
uniref:Uncharacterized protein n=1 Tax=Anguilla anguilla TaxID=7936 RepID=A0A0E9TNM7_ANGAN